MSPMDFKKSDLWWRVGTVAVLVAAVSVLHYGTQTSRPLLHDVYRRLYYMPVGLAAVWFGVRGGLITSAVVAALYAPHVAMDWLHLERELVNRVMEVGLYFVFAAAIGYFADQERRLRLRCQEAAGKLDRSYKELRRQADQILEIEGQLRRADRLAAIGELAAGMTHEIRNPLGAIKGTAEILKDDFPPGHPKGEFLEILLRETERLNGVVEEFLGYARSKGSGGEETEPVDLSRLVRETATLFSAQSRKGGVVLDVGGEEGLTVSGSGAQLKQVVLNLLLNAAQASPQGRAVRVRTEVRTGTVVGPEYREVEGRLAAVVVEDEGPGLPPDVRDRVFKPFFTTKEEGTGLGLAISQRIARAHGGDLTGENREDGGARFVLTVPLLDQSDSREVGGA
ncbi:MAG: ATP-binding protein [Deferrisomatales bacterium]